MNDEKPGRTEWDFYSLALKVGLTLFVFGALFLLARKGDVAAIAILVALAVLALVGAGAWVVLAILDRQAAAEQKRFTANLKENLIYIQTMQRVQNAQLLTQTRANRDLLAANQRLAGALPKPGEELDVDALVWDVVDELESEL